MTGIEIIILIVIVVVGAGAIAYYMTKGQPSLKEMTEDYYNNEEAQEVVELAKELYNKDLRPIAAKKAPKEEKVKEVSVAAKAVEEAKKETKSEFPIDKPKKKRKYYPKKK
jgi:hypothetical protein